MNARRFTDHEDRILRQLHADGLSLRDVAMWLERDDGVVLRHARLLGLEFAPQRELYTSAEDEAIRLNFPHFPTFLVAHVIGRTASSVTQRAARLGLKKAPDFYSKPLAALWDAREHPNTIAGRFKPGQVPPNKGTRRPGWAPGRMASTQFKKGSMNGAAQHNYVPVGSLRIDGKDGYLERKITDDHPVPARRWVAVHRLVWEAAHGPIPAGHVVGFKAGMKTNVEAEITLDRLEMISRRELMLRNTIHNYPEEIVRAVQMRGALNRVINQRTRSARP